MKSFGTSVITTKVLVVLIARLVCFLLALPDAGLSDISQCETFHEGEYPFGCGRWVLVTLAPQDTVFAPLWLIVVANDVGPL